MRFRCQYSPRYSLVDLARFAQLQLVCDVNCVWVGASSYLTVATEMMIRICERCRQQWSCRHSGLARELSAACKLNLWLQ